MVRRKSTRVKASRADTLRTLVNRLAHEDEAVTLLRTAVNGHNRLLLVNLVIALSTELHLQDLPKSSDLITEIVRWIIHNPSQSPQNLRDAVVTFQDERRRKRQLHRSLADRLGLNRSTGQSWVKSLPRRTLARLTLPYPPLGHFVSESPEITRKWEQRLLRDPQPDPRQARRPIHPLDAGKLQLEVPSDESCAIVDENDGSIVAIILRGIVQEDDQLQAEFLSWAVETIQNGIIGRRSIRREDPGMMIQTGYSAGARSKPAFGWVRNLERKNELTPEFLASADYQTSCLFALAWNICRAQLPKEVMDGWFEWLEGSQLPCMDAGVHMAGTHGDYHIRIGEDTITFYNAELAPPTGLLNQNYARAMHFERQPHRYALQWILGRSHPADQGSHFYIGSYAAKIVLTQDTLIVWRPADVHGTSLANYSPYDLSPAFQQLGIAIVTPPRLKSVYQHYIASFTSSDTLAQPVPFSKRWTEEDNAAKAAAEVFIEEMVRGIVEDL